MFTSTVSPWGNLERQRFTIDPSTYKTPAWPLKSNLDTLQRFYEALKGGSIKEAARILESTSQADLPIVFGDAQHRILLNAYREVPAQWAMFCQVGDIPDFRISELVSVSAGEDLEEVRELEEIPRSKIKDHKENTQLAVFAKQYDLSWQMIVNDDLGALQRLPQMHGARAASTLNKLFFVGILQGNPVMADGLNLFHADHNNLITGAPLNDTNLQLAYEKLVLQTDKQGNVIQTLVNKPRLVVGPKLHMQARKLVSSTLVPDNSLGGDPIARDGNPLRGMFDEPVMVPHLGTSLDWYVIANPNDIDTVRMSFLQGTNRMPMVFQKASQWVQMGGSANSTAAMHDTSYMVRLVATAKAADHRGMVKGQAAA